MKKRKLLLIPLVLSSLVCLSACSEVSSFFSELLDENAFSYSNVYSSHDFTVKSEPLPEGAIVAGGVAAKDAEETPNAYCFKNIPYVNESNLVTNTYKLEGVNQNEFNVNNNEDYSSSKANNNYDLYVPKNLNKN